MRTKNIILRYIEHSVTLSFSSHFFHFLYQDMRWLFSEIIDEHGEKDSKSSNFSVEFGLNWKWKWSRSVMSDSLRSHGLQPTRLLCPWDSPGKSTGVGCHCLLLNVGQQRKKWNYQAIEKDTDVGKDWRPKEKGAAEDEMVGWHHRLDGHEFEQALGDGEG